jgi:translation initiation factor IF-1
MVDNFIPESNKLVRNSNYNVWKNRIAQAMRKENCWYICVQDIVLVEIADTKECLETTGEGTTAKRKKKTVIVSETDNKNHEKAMHMLMCLVCNDVLPMIQLNHLPQQAWKTLKRAFEVSNPNCIFHLHF